jgi:zinc transport system substrate-binding protein
MEDRMRRSALLGTVFLASFALNPAQAEEAPAVVASILPVGSIAAAVMDGVGEPVVLLEPGASPHAFSMRPTQAQALDDADVIFWVGPDLESFLSRPLDALGGDARQVALAEVSGIELLPYREGALFESHDDEHDEAHDDHAHDEHSEDEHAHDEHAHDEAHDEHAHEEHAEDEHGHEEHAHDHGEMDAHIWLSPANAQVIAEAMAATLAEVDPAHAEQYKANAAGFADRLAAVEEEIEATLEPVRGQPFVVFHDAYHYYEQAFDIEAAGAIHLNPEVPPGAARVAEIQARIGELGAACVFAEPQFEPRVVETVIEGSSARTGVLDPLGSDIAMGPDGYPALLLNLATSLADCLGD